MLVRINKKPITITEEEEDERPDWILFCIKCVGYFFIAYLLDYVCYTFFYIHPIPVLHTLLHFIRGLL